MGYSPHSTKFPGDAPFIICRGVGLVVHLLWTFKDKDISLEIPGILDVFALSSLNGSRQNNNFNTYSRVRHIVGMEDLMRWECWRGEWCGRLYHRAHQWCLANRWMAWRVIIGMHVKCSNRSNFASKGKPLFTVYLLCSTICRHNSSLTLSVSSHNSPTTLKP